MNPLYCIGKIDAAESKLNASANDFCSRRVRRFTVTIQPKTSKPMTMAMVFKASNMISVMDSGCGIP